jgi:hypothetical protein
MRNLLITCSVVCLILAATGVQAAVITDATRIGNTPGEPEIVAGPSPGGLQEGSHAFMDRPLNPDDTRNYHWEGIPAELVGADYVKTYNEDKQGSYPNPELVSYSVTLGSAARLYIFIDHRYVEEQGDPPFTWLTDGSSGAVFVDTGLDIMLNEVGGREVLQPFDVYAAEVPAGTYTLGSTYRGNPSRNFYSIAAVGPKIDIKPETLNLNSKGVFTVFIDLPEGFDEEDIDISTVECEGASALKGVMADDGRLIVKFDREDLEGVSPGDAVEMVVTGQLNDGTHFTGSDTIRVIDKGGKKK